MNYCNEYAEESRASRQASNLAISLVPTIFLNNVLGHLNYVFIIICIWTDELHLLNHIP